ncbi:unnamed protein product, partial [marine sediment metagenome]
MRTLLYITFFAILALPAVLQAADEGNGTYEENKKRWEEMTDAEKDTVREAYRRWKNLPEPERRELRAKFEKFKVLEPDRKLAFAINARRWRRLEPDKREKIRKYISSRLHAPKGPAPLHAMMRITG